MVKTKRKSILRTLLCVVFALCFAVGLSSLFASGTTAYAAAVTTPKYAIPISYSTWYSSNGGKSITGGGTALSFSARIGQFNSSTYSVSLYGSGESGTATWDGYIRSSTVTIVLSSSSGTPTVSVVNSAGKGVGSGTKTITLTGLADGTYTASFGASGGWLVNARQYDSVGFNASFTFTVDQSAPTVSGASTSSTGKYTNSSTYVSASDSGSGVSALYVKSPNSNSYSSVGTSTTIASTATNGLYSFYAKDKAGNTSRTYFLYLDTVKPTGTIKNSNGTEITGSYDDIAARHKNWNVLRKYVDEGITGTQAKKRPSFLQMIQDAKQKKFDLIVTREVCRFARNTVDTLVVTRELKNYGVEVYFVEDNIWTMDGDGELRLTIMATLAQEESRKTSERVRAGQKISRDKGVLYGNGNILGYDRDKVTGTYVINPEQAETVRMIYDLYSSGHGMGQIRDEMIRRGRRDSSGLVRWDYSRISRVLHNSTYKGYPAYLKSRRNNFLDQKIIRNHDENTYMYVKGDFEPIISEEQWDRCRQIREQRKRQCHYFTPDGEVLHTTGVHLSSDIWVKKLVCRCGHRMRRNKWRKNKNGEIVYGYKCYNQLNNGSKSVREQSGVDTGTTCDLREICDWKLEMMARHIFSGLWGDRQDILNQVSLMYQVGSYEKSRQTDEVKSKLNQEIAKLDEKMKRLTRMRLDDEISKADYLEYKSEIERDREKLIQQRTAFEAGIETDCGCESAEGKIQNFLLQKMDFTEHRIDREVISQFVDTVIPRTETCYEWYMDFDLVPKPNDEKKMVWGFTINYNEARAYRSEKEGMLRPNQWADLTVKVYV